MCGAKDRRPPFHGNEVHNTGVCKLHTVHPAECGIRIYDYGVETANLEFRFGLVAFRFRRKDTGFVTVGRFTPVFHLRIATVDGLGSYGAREPPAAVLLRARMCDLVRAMCVAGGLKILFQRISKFIDFFLTIFGSPGKQFLQKNKKKGTRKTKKELSLGFSGRRRFERGG